MNTAPIKSKPDGLAGADPSVTVLAPAKINLFLHIVGRREDGRHELESIFAFADIGDRLRLERSDNFSLTLSGPFADDLGEAGTGENDNLVIRAAKKLAARVGQAAYPVAIRLEKNLPVAAGIGGGSADAAAALRGLSELWDAQLPADQMHELALQLGADVPACLAGATARVTGIGEIVEPSQASIHNFHAVLVNPRVHLSTAAVFNGYREASSVFSDRLDQWPDGVDQDLLGALAGCHNDLSEAAITEVPVIADVLGTLQDQQQCRIARMSGSGATCFGLFDSRDAARRAAQGLSSLRPEWWVVATTLGSIQKSGGQE